MYCCRVYIKVFEDNPKGKEDSGVSCILIVFNRVHQLKDGQGGVGNILYISDFQFQQIWGIVLIIK